MPDIRPSIEEDVKELAPKLREADLMEIKAASGKDPESVLLFGHLCSRPGLSIVSDDGEVIAMAGAVPAIHEGPALVWMLASDALTEGRHVRPLLRRGREVVEFWNQKYPLLYNSVDARNTVHIRWIEWCGFKFTGEEFGGVEGRLFKHFTRTNHV